jgi:hypothetical protein
LTSGTLKRLCFSLLSTFCVSKGSLFTLHLLFATRAPPESKPALYTYTGAQCKQSSVQNEKSETQFYSQERIAKHLEVSKRTIDSCLVPLAHRAVLRQRWRLPSPILTCHFRGVGFTKLIFSLSRGKFVTLTMAA